MSGTLFGDAPIPIESQVACVQREIRMRESVYPRWVSAGRMKAEKADDEIACMRAVLETLQRVAATGERQ